MQGNDATGAGFMFTRRSRHVPKPFFTYAIDFARKVIGLQIREYRFDSDTRLQ